MRPLKVALVQTDPGSDKVSNVRRALEWIAEAAAEGAELVVLPETFHCRGPYEVKMAAAEAIPGPLSRELSETAARHGIHLLAGSFNERVADSEDPRTYNTSLLFGPDGTLLARYRKIHLFDVVIDGRVQAAESTRNRPGSDAVVADTAFGTVGLSICYDLRFPELYRNLALRGAILAFAPSNFTTHTGKDHWEVLLRARAIENGMYILAPATIGNEGGGFVAYGRSMIVDPWGTVLACAADQEGVLMATIDLDRVASVRSSLPSLHHRRPESYDL